MELEVFVDKDGNCIKQNFVDDFETECPFCFTVNKYIIERCRDLYCSKCKKLLILVLDRELVKRQDGLIKNKTIEELIEILITSPSAGQRIYAAIDLGAKGDMDCIPALREAGINDSDKEVRDQAMLAFERIKEIYHRLSISDKSARKPSKTWSRKEDRGKEVHHSFLEKLSSSSDLELIIKIGRASCRERV